MSSALDAFIQASGNVVTVLTLCFGQPSADPSGRGCLAKWVAPGRHMTECRILAERVTAKSGDRLQCSVQPLDRERAARLFQIEGVCR